jgi:hypothetical protein
MRDARPALNVSMRTPERKASTISGRLADSMAPSTRPGEYIEIKMAAAAGIERNGRLRRRYRRRRGNMPDGERIGGSGKAASEARPFSGASPVLRMGNSPELFNTS